MLFLSRRFSSVRSATRTFMSRTSRLRSLTSPLVAARAVSPARRFFPASGTPSTSCSTGSRRCPPAGRARRCCTRPAAPQARYGSSPQPNGASGSSGECSSQSVRASRPASRISVLSYDLSGFRARWKPLPGTPICREVTGDGSVLSWSSWTVDECDRPRLFFWPERIHGH